MAPHAPLIVPSVLPADAARLGEEVEALCTRSSPSTDGWPEMTAEITTDVVPGSTGMVAGAPGTDALAVSTLRFLAADMAEEAPSGHPGLPGRPGPPGLTPAAVAARIAAAIHAETTTDQTRR